MSPYAGIRHALPVVVLLSIFAGLFTGCALESNSIGLKGIVALAYLAACISSVPVMRPWEYFNEIVGGARNGPNYFGDEGVDLGQRTKELIAYYRQNLQPKGELADSLYHSSTDELKAYGVDFWDANTNAICHNSASPNTWGLFSLTPWLPFLIRIGI